MGNWDVVAMHLAVAGHPVSPAFVAASTGIGVAEAKRRLARLVWTGEARRVAAGLYFRPDRRPPS